MRCVGDDRMIFHPGQQNPRVISAHFWRRVNMSEVQLSDDDSTHSTPFSRMNVNTFANLNVQCTASNSTHLTQFYQSSIPFSVCELKFALCNRRRVGIIVLLLSLHDIIGLNIIPWSLPWQKTDNRIETTGLHLTEAIKNMKSTKPCSPYFRLHFKCGI